LTLGALRFAPGGAKGLSSDLELDFLAVADVQIPGRMLVRTAFRAADHHFAADVRIAQGCNEDLPALAARVFYQAVRGEVASANRRDVHDMSLGAAGPKV